MGIGLDILLCVMSICATTALLFVARWRQDKKKRILLLFYKMNDMAPVVAEQLKQDIAAQGIIPIMVSMMAASDGRIGMEWLSGEDRG